MAKKVSALEAELEEVLTDEAQPDEDAQPEEQARDDRPQAVVYLINDLTAQGSSVPIGNWFFCVPGTALGGEFYAVEQAGRHLAGFVQLQTLVNVVEMQCRDKSLLHAAEGLTLKQGSVKMMSRLVPAERLGL